MNKSKKHYQNFGIYDFSDYAEEVTGDALFKINGGSTSCSNEAPSSPSTAPSLAPKESAPTQTTTTTTTPAPAPAQTTTTPSGPTGPSSSDVPEEIKTNPQAYAAYMAKQDQAKSEGEPDRYKGYNVLGKEIISTFNDYLIEKKTGTITDFSIGYGLVEDLGLYGSAISTSYVVKDSKLKLLNSANFSKKYSPDNFSYQYGGEITLIINDKPVETQKLVDDGSAKIFSPDFPPIGDCYFNTYIPKGANVKIKYDINLCVNNAYVGGTYATKELF